MSMLNPEAKAVEPQAAVVDVSQQNIEANLAQKKLENPEQKEQSAAEPENPDWKAFREARKKDRAEKEVAEQRVVEKEREVAALKAAMEAAFSAKSAPTPQAYQQYYGMNEQPEEDEEKKIERKVNELLAKREEQYKHERIEEEKREYPKRLMRDFPDFGQVCSQENLDYLDFHYPEISRPLQRLGEGYDKWHDTYHAVRKLIPNHTTAKKEANRAEINSNKPRSISSTGPSPTGEAPRQDWQTTEARRAENWSRMQRTMKSTG